MVAAVLFTGVRLIAAVAVPSVAINGDVGLDTKDRLHASILGFQIKFHRTEHIAVVGDRDSVHAEFLHPLE